MAPTAPALRSHAPQLPRPRARIPRSIALALLLVVPVAFVPSSVGVSHDTMAGTGFATGTVWTTASGTISCSGSVVVAMVEADRTLTLRWVFASATDAACADLSNALSGTFEDYQGSRSTGYSWQAFVATCDVEIRSDPPGVLSLATTLVHTASCGNAVYAARAPVTYTPGVPLTAATGAGVGRVFYSGFPITYPIFLRADCEPALITAHIIGRGSENTVVMDTDTSIGAASDENCALFAGGYDQVFEHVQGTPDSGFTWSESGDCDVRLTIGPLPSLATDFSLIVDCPYVQVEVEGTLAFVFASVAE